MSLRTTARESLQKTGKTHKGKANLGRPFQGDPAAIATWQKDNKASIKSTADHWKLSTATVKRYMDAAT